MIYPQKIKPGATVGIVCLSSGVLGEPFVKHEQKLLEERLRQLGLKFKYMTNSLKGEEFLKDHPEKKAEDLKEAFLDDEVDVVWSALGGDDTFRILPYLMNEEFKKTIEKHPKPFLGFSDTTNNHLMFYQLGLATLYAPALLSDIAELGPEIFPFTREWIDKLFTADKNIEIKSSPVWYEARTAFDEGQLGIERVKRKEKHGHEFLYGDGVVKGNLLGGCLDSLYEMLVGGRYDDQIEVYRQYKIFPTKEQWKDKVVFIETSEEKPTPQKLTKMLKTLENYGVFDVARALIIGKPQDEIYYHEYKEIYKVLAKKHKLPTVFNLNFGHTAPRLILPYDMPIKIDFIHKKIILTNGVIGDKIYERN